MISGHEYIDRARQYLSELINTDGLDATEQMVRKATATNTAANSTYANMLWYVAFHIAMAEYLERVTSFNRIRGL